MISCGISIKAGVHPYLMKQDLQITSSISRPDALPFVILDNARELQFNGRTFPQFLHCLIAHRLERILSRSKAYLSLTNCGLFTHACHGFTTSLLYKPTTTAQFLLRLCTERLFTVYETLHKSKLTKTLKDITNFCTSLVINLTTKLNAQYYDSSQSVSVGLDGGLSDEFEVSGVGDVWLDREVLWWDTATPRTWSSLSLLHWA